jgi:hypothetical protein
MKKFIQRVFSRLLWVIVLGSIFFCCAKTGPQGATGPAGNNGSPGPVGPTGPQGPQGNANVLVDTFTLTSADWSWNSLYSFSTGSGSYTSYFTRFHDATDSLITQAILNTGLILVYFTPYQNNANQWEPLPYSFLAFSSAYYYNFVFETFLYKVRLHYFYSANGSGSTPTNLSTTVIPNHSFKIIVVSGTIATGMHQAGVDPADWRQVSRYLNL